MNNSSLEVDQIMNNNKKRILEEKVKNMRQDKELIEYKKKWFESIFVLMYYNREVINHLLLRR